MLCVSIAAPTVPAARETAENALAGRAGMVEVRLDAIDRVGVEDFRALSGKTPEQILLTDPYTRSPSLVTQYRKLKETASFVAPCWTDVPPPRLPPSHLVASWHDHKETPSTEELHRLWGTLARRARERAPSVVKIACRANSLAEALRLAALAKEINSLLPPRRNRGVKRGTSTRKRRPSLEEAPLRLACHLIEKGGMTEAREGMKALLQAGEAERLIELVQRSFRLAPYGLLAGVTRGAAILFSSIEADRRDEVLAQLDPETLEKVSEAVENLGTVPPIERGRIEKDFSSVMLAVQYIEQGGMEYAQRLMAKILLPGKAEQMIEGLRADLRATPFPFVLLDEVPGSGHGPKGWGRGVTFEGPLPTIAVGMGEFGSITRLLYRRFGMPWMFCSPDAGMMPPKITFPPTAPGQFTFSEMHSLYRSDLVGPKTRVFGLIGDPVSHSRGPELFNKAFAEGNVDAIYVPVRMDDVKCFPELQRLTEAAGWSVTIPHKETIREFCDELSPAAKAIGAVNTLVVKEGRIEGHNTDWIGVCAALAAGVGAEAPAAEASTRRIRWGDRLAAACAKAGVKSALILGAGGGARAAAYACIEAGLAVTVSGRTPERASAMVEGTPAQAAPWGKREEVDADLIINATPVGMAPDTDATPYPARAWETTRTGFDMVYTPAETRFLREARAAGARAIPGTGMFLAQANSQCRLWLGRDLPTTSPVK